MPLNLFGIAEIADLLGVTRQRADQIARSVGFPPTVADLAAGRIWEREAVEGWAAATRREIRRVHTRFRGLSGGPAAHCEACGSRLFAEKDSVGRSWTACALAADLPHSCLPPFDSARWISWPCEVCGKVWEYQPHEQCWKVVAPGWWPSAIASRVRLEAVDGSGRVDAVGRAVYFDSDEPRFVLETDGFSLATWQLEAEPALKRLAYSVLAGAVDSGYGAVVTVSGKAFPAYAEAVRSLLLQKRG